MICPATQLERPLLPLVRPLGGHLCSAGGATQPWTSARGSASRVGDRICSLCGGHADSSHAAAQHAVMMGSPGDNGDDGWCARTMMTQGPFPHVPPAEPMGNWDTSFGIPWWKDKKYQIGSLSSRTRVVRVKNVLTGQEDCLEVPSEENVVEIRERYLEINWHAASYTFKALVTGEGGTDFQVRCWLPPWSSRWR